MAGAAARKAKSTVGPCLDISRPLNGNWARTCARSSIRGNLGGSILWILADSARVRCCP